MYCLRAICSYLMNACVPHMVLYNCYLWHMMQRSTYAKWMLLHAVVHMLVYTPVYTQWFGKPMDVWIFFNFDTVILIIFVIACNAYQKLKHF